MSAGWKPFWMAFGVKRIVTWVFVSSRFWTAIPVASRLSPSWARTRGRKVFCSDPRVVLY